MRYDGYLGVENGTIAAEEWKKHLGMDSPLTVPQKVDFKPGTFLKSITKRRSNDPEFRGLKKTTGKETADDPLQRANKLAAEAHKGNENVGLHTGGKDSRRRGA